MVTITYSPDLTLLIPFLSWSFLPAIATKVLLSSLYTLGILRRPRTSERATRHYQHVTTLVIVVYLLYSLIRAVQLRTGPQNNYYGLLGGLPIRAGEDDIRRNFRILARRYHPDKVRRAVEGKVERSTFGTPSKTEDASAAAEHLFILIRRASEVLQDPVKRFAYDRFGPTVTDWREASTVRDHMDIGLKSSLGFYVMNLVAGGFFRWLQGAPGSTFWRNASLGLLFVYEFQLLVYMTAMLAIQQLTPVLFAMARNTGRLVGATSRATSLTQAEEQIRALSAAAQSLLSLSEASRGEAAFILGEELRPFQSAVPSTAGTLQGAARRIATGSAKAPDDRRTTRRQTRGFGAEAWVTVLSDTIVHSHLQSIPAVQQLVAKAIIRDVMVGDVRSDSDRGQAYRAATVKTEDAFKGNVCDADEIASLNSGTARLSEADDPQVVNVKFKVEASLSSRDAASTDLETEVLAQVDGATPRQEELTRRDHPQQTE